MGTTQRIWVATIALGLVAIASYVVVVSRPGEVASLPPDLKSASPANVEVRQNGWVEGLVERTRVVGVSSSEVPEVKDALESGAEFDAAFDLETLGPLSQEDLGRVRERLKDSLAGATMELLERQNVLESAAGDGLREYRLWLESMANVESYKAAISEFGDGHYFTMAPTYALKLLPLPSDYTYVGMTLRTSSGERRFVAVPYARSAWPHAGSMQEEAKTMRGVEWSQFVQEFNSLPIEERRKKIGLHNTAKASLKKGFGKLGSAEIVNLQGQLLPGPFLINSVKSTIRAPRM